MDRISIQSACLHTFVIASSILISFSPAAWVGVDPFSIDIGRFEREEGRPALAAMASSANPALDPDLDRPDNPGHELAQFGAGCFWGVELAFQRLAGVVKTEVGYSQGHAVDPTYKLVCSGTTGHAEVVRVQFDPEVCPYTDLLALFWSRHDPTSLNRQV